MLSLGIITKKGPDVFELFGGQKERVPNTSKTISLEQIEKKFEEIDLNEDGTIDQQEIKEYLAGHFLPLFQVYFR